MKKRKQPQQSFSSMVSNQALANLKPYIDANVDVKMAHVERRLTSQVVSTIQSTFARTLALEELLMEMNPAITKEILAEKVSDKIDSLLGLKKIDKTEKGCRARVTIESKYENEAEFNSPSKTMIDNLGSGNSLTLEIEEKLLGLSAGDNVVIDIPPDGENPLSGQLRITIDRASKGESDEGSVQK